jgi:hypothetical protein
MCVHHASILHAHTQASDPVSDLYKEYVGTIAFSGLMGGAVSYLVRVLMRLYVCACACVRTYMILLRRLCV